MQYPIIDNLIYAYQRNGWTGLELTPSKNILETLAPGTIVTNGVTFIVNEDKSILINGTASGNAILRLNDNIGWFSPDTTYTMSGSDSESTTGTYRLQWNINGVTGPISYGGNVSIYTTPSEITTSVVYIVVLNGNTVDNAVFYPQIELGTVATPYEPYALPTTDIKDRLKLPMIHYFPHPVIDALISAADGQHTEEEKEILRHYLTPLGIGGI